MLNTRRRIFGLLVSVFMVIISMSTFVHAGQLDVKTTEDIVSVVLDGKKLTFDVPPQIINGRTFVPLRTIFEAMGAIVEWDNDTQTVTATNAEIVVKMQIGNNLMIKNSEKITLDVPAQIVNGRTLVPVRAIAECFGAIVEWKEDINTVVITYIPQINNETSVNDNETKIDNNVTDENNNENVSYSNNNEPEKLSCDVSLSHTVVSVSDEYKIVYSVTVISLGGKPDYRFRYEVYQNENVTSSCEYGKENHFEGTIKGKGKCVLVVYVKDYSGEEVKQEFVLNEG